MENLLRIREFAQDLKVLIVRHDINFAEVLQALVILDLEAEEMRRKAMNKTMA